MGAAEQDFRFDPSQPVNRRLAGVYGWVFGGPGSINPSNPQHVACPRWVAYPPVRHLIQQVSVKNKSSCYSLPKTTKEAAGLVERCRRIQAVLQTSAGKAYMAKGLRLEVAPPSHTWHTALVSHAWHLSPTSHAWHL